jgi:hypothetical protein
MTAPPRARFFSISVVLSPMGWSRTFGGRSGVGGAEEEDQWTLKNRRRLYLIDK